MGGQSLRQSAHGEGEGREVVDRHGRGVHECGVWAGEFWEGGEFDSCLCHALFPLLIPLGVVVVMT